MTVIAWDGTTLAADKQATTGSTRQATTKIFRIGNSIVGICGDLSVGMEMLNWAKKGYIPEDFPKSNRDPNAGCSLIRISGPNDVYKYESSPYPFMRIGKCAFGSGLEAALAAMHVGADAKLAVEAACEYNIECGMGVDTLTLKDLE